MSRGLDGYFYLRDACFIGCCVVLKAREGPVSNPVGALGGMPFPALGERSS